MHWNYWRFCPNLDMKNQPPGLQGWLQISWLNQKYYFDHHYCLCWFLWLYIWSCWLSLERNFFKHILHSNFFTFTLICGDVSANSNVFFSFKSTSFWISSQLDSVRSSVWTNCSWFNKMSLVMNTSEHNLRVSSSSNGMFSVWTDFSWFNKLFLEMNTSEHNLQVNSSSNGLI